MLGANAPTLMLNLTDFFLLTRNRTYSAATRYVRHFLNVLVVGGTSVGHSP